MNENLIAHEIAGVHQSAARLHGILIQSEGVRIKIGEMRDAADCFVAQLGNESFGPQQSCDLMNTLFQLSVFFVNSGTGLEQRRETKMHPLFEKSTIEHAECWTNYFNGMVTVLEQRGDINAWLEVNPIPPGQPGMASVSEMNARKARASTLPPPPPPTQPTVPRLTRKFMWKYRPIETRTVATMHEPMPPLEVELVDGELNYISEGIQTVFVVGDPVMLPASPCLSDEWDQWLVGFLRTHPFAGGENIGHRQETCYVIREQ